jgi:hypothetical protein
MTEAGILLPCSAQPREKPTPGLVDEIIAECGRLALAIALVGSSLRGGCADPAKSGMNLPKPV